MVFTYQSRLQLDPALLAKANEGSPIGDAVKSYITARNERLNYENNLKQSQLNEIQLQEALKQQKKNQIIDSAKANQGKWVLDHPEEASDDEAYNIAYADNFEKLGLIDEAKAIKSGYQELKRKTIIDFSKLVADLPLKKKWTPEAILGLHKLIKDDSILNKAFGGNLPITEDVSMVGSTSLLNQNRLIAENEARSKGTPVEYDDPITNTVRTAYPPPVKQSVISESSIILADQRKQRELLTSLQNAVLAGKVDPNKVMEVELPSGETFTYSFAGTPRGMERQNKIDKAMASDDYLNTKSGLKSAQKAINILSSNPNIYKRMLNPLDDTAVEYKAELGNMVDTITRIRTGAALNKDEQEFYTKNFGGSWFNNPKAVKYKLELLSSIFNDYLEGSIDPFKIKNGKVELSKETHNLIRQAMNEGFEKSIDNKSFSGSEKYIYDPVTKKVKLQ